MKRRLSKPDDDLWDLNNMTEKMKPNPQIVKTKGDTKKSQRDSQSISWLWPLLILAGGCVLFYVIHLIDHRLPKPITKIEAELNPELFSAERSRDILRKLTSLGPRIAGDVVNEVHAPLIIEKEVEDIQSKANPVQSISYQRQKGSGAYFLAFKYGITNVYENIQNVIVLMKGSEGKQSILINCHYDTVPVSEGASDDAIACSVMLELIRVLSLSDKRLKHNLVFLFNGAEEAPLLGAHLFLEHDWAKQCRIVLNLDAAGHGGRAILFQTGPKHSWIFDYYAKNAPHPHALVMSEELFQSGVIPSDSDFRVFRDFGDMIGLDFAFARNGYVYHTMYDTEQHLPLGSYQHLGDNILAVLKELGFAPELYNIEENPDGEVIFYDYLGFYLISYSVEISFIINLIAIVLAILSVVVYIGRVLNWSWLPQNYKINFYKSESDKEKSQLDANLISKKDTENKEKVLVPQLNTPIAILKELGISVIACISGQIIGIVLAVLVSLIISRMAEFAMPWYSNVWLLFPLFWCPCLVASAGVPYLADIWRQKNRQLTPYETTQLNLVAAQIPTVLIFFGLTYLGIKSSSIYLLPVLSSAIANLLLHLTNIHKWDYKWVVLYTLLHSVSLVFQLYLVLLTYSMLIAITGRSGAINTDFYLSLASALFSIFSIGPLLPLLGAVKKRIVVLGVLGAISVVGVLMVLRTSIVFPYKAGPIDPAPQRYWIMHSDRQFYDESQELRRHETGYFVMNYDPNSPRTIPEEYKDGIQSMETDCENEMNCGLPYYTTRMFELGPRSSWIPASPPQIPQKTYMTVTKVCQINDSICQIQCSLKGPDRITLTLSPRDGAELINWSIPSPITESTKWKGRPYYYIMLFRGEVVGEYNITLDFRVSPEQMNGSPIVDVGLAGNHAHHESERTKDFQDFLNSFPVWTTMIGWISAYKVYVF